MTYQIETVTVADLTAVGWDRDAAWNALGLRDSAVVVSNVPYTASQTLDHLSATLDHLHRTRRRNDNIIAGVVGAYPDKLSAWIAIEMEAAIAAANA